MPEAIKLTLSVDGAAAAKTAVEGVTDAVETNTDAVRKAGAEAAASTARRRAAIASVEAEMAAEKKAAAAREESARAAAKDAEGMSVLEKQAKRAADQVERLALARGKSDEVAHAMGDATFERVRAGDQSPGRAVWTAKSGLAAEAQALREIAAQAGPAESGLGRVGGTLAATTVKTNGLAAAGRLLANAILPDVLVSRVLAGGRALIGVLSGMSAAAIGLTGVLGGILVAGFYKFREAQKDNQEAGEKLNKTLDEQAKMAELAADRHDMLRKDLGANSLENAAKSYSALARETEEYATSLRHANDELAANLEAETARIALTESLELAAIRKKYAPDIAAARKEASDARRAETAIGVEYDAKVLAAKSPEEAASLAAQRDEAKARARDRAEIARERRVNLEAEQSDAMAVARSTAVLAKAKAEAVAVEREVSLAREEVYRARIGLQYDEMAAAELGAVSDKYLGQIKALPGAQLKNRPDILNAVDKTDRDKAIADQITLLKETETKAKEKDAEIRDMEDAIFIRPATKKLNLRRLRDERAEMGDPTGAIALLGNYQKAAGLAEEADKTLPKTREEVAKVEAAFARVKLKATVAKGTLDVAKSNAEVDAAERAQSSDERTATTADASAKRTAAAANDASLQREASAEVASVAYELANYKTLHGEQSGEVSRLVDAARSVIAYGNADGRWSKGELDTLVTALGNLAAASKSNAESTAALRAEIARIDALAKEVANQVRTGGAR